MIYRAKAPLRLGFGGGGSDVPPFSELHGGYVLNATINKYVYVTVEPIEDSKIHIISHDFKQSFTYDANKRLPYDGNLDLIKACLNKVAGLTTDRRKRQGFNLYIRSDAPPGVGLGTSSTVVVSVLGALLEAKNIRLNAYDIAKMAWKVERKDLGLLGGKQDQYAAAFGGINFMEFHKDGEVIINSLRVSKSVINELQHNILLAYTGIRHDSSNIIKEQCILNEKRINELEHIKEIAVAMKEDLMTEEIVNFGNLLSLDWQHKKELSSKISSGFLDDIADKAIQYGAEGLKITGAGGGGVFIIYCNWKKKKDIANAMIESGCEIIDFTITKTGLETWFVK